MSRINEDYVSIRKAANLLDISDHTIARWYKWFESEEFEKPEGLVLPPYVYKDRRRTRYFKKSDIPKLKEFSEKLRTTYRGCMSEFNAVYQWGKRGKRALTNKGEKYEEIRKMIR